MAFLCQNDPYLKERNSIIETCEEGVFEDNKIYKITLEESIFFPTGGGQPYDQGYINDSLVINVIRENNKAVIYCTESFEIGSTVNCVLDWTRRYNHMQHHTTQHLISALFETHFGYKTVSWELGHEFCHIELETNGNPIDQETKSKIEKLANDLIKIHTPVTVTRYSDPSLVDQVLRMSVKSIPTDAKGDIRVVTIEGIDSNKCCGTHVRNLSEIQRIMLFHTTETRGHCRVFFMAGDRLAEHFHRLTTRENSLTKILGNGPSEHLKVVESMRMKQKTIEKELKYLHQELALKDAEAIVLQLNDRNLIFHQRDISAQAYLQTLASRIIILFPNLSGKLIIATINETKSCGYFCAIGDSHLLKKYEEKIMTVIDGKGFLKCGKIMGKASKLFNIARLQEKLKSYING